MVETSRDFTSEEPAKGSARTTKVLIGWLRRCHLYLGLFLAPWALLYGVTGYLFNHPTHFSDRGLKDISRATLIASGFDGTLALPHEAAKEVVTKINERFPEVKLELADNHDAKYIGDFFFATSTGSQKAYQLLIRRDGGGGTYLDSTPTPKSVERIAEFVINPQTATTAGVKAESSLSPVSATEPLKINQSAAAVMEKILPELTKRLDVPGLDQPFRLTSAPQLQFRAISQGNRWLVKYDSFRGSVSAVYEEPSKERQSMSWRSYFLKLHTAHGYSGIYEARWFWAIVVDSMAFVMFFWAISGFAMWWQIKRLRAVGFMIILLSLAAAAGLFWGMAQELNSTPF